MASIRSLGMVLPLAVAGVARGQCELDKMLADDGDMIDQLGLSVAIAGEVAVAGAPGAAVNGDASGAAYVYERDAETGDWPQRQTLLPANGAPFDFFGIAAAIDGDLIVVGAPQSQPRAGAAYLYQRQGDAWIERTMLQAGDADSGDQFGSAVAVIGPCDFAAVGAPGDDERGGDAGAVYVFHDEGTKWVQLAKLTASDAAPNALFGASVAIGDDGATILVGAPGGQGKKGATGAGYVFQRAGDTWEEVFSPRPPNGEVTDAFGSAVAVDGDWALIGAPSHNAAGEESGAIYFFHREDGIWGPQPQKVLPPDAFAGQRLGTSVALAEGRAFAGVGKDDDAGENAGAAYFYRLGGNQWVQVQKLLPSDGVGGEYFGLATALGDRAAIVGAPLDDDNGLFSGSTYVFRAETDELPFEADPARSELSIAVDFPGRDLQEFLLHLTGPMTASFTPDCELATSVYVPQLDWPAQEKLIELQLPNEEVLTLTELVVRLRTPGAPAPIDRKGCPEGQWGCGVLPGYEIVVEASDGGAPAEAGRALAGGVFLAGAFVECLLNIGGTYPFDDGLPAPGDILTITFPVDMSFVVDLGFEDENPTVTVVGELVSHLSGGLPCPADIDASGDVGFPDLLALLSAWGPYEPCPPYAPGDIDQDCEVAFNDLLSLLAAWGPCP